MDPPNRRGVKNRQADGGCCRRSPFLRAEQRDYVTAKTRIRDRAVVAVRPWRTADANLLFRDGLRLVDALAEARCQRSTSDCASPLQRKYLWRSKSLYQSRAIHLFFKIMKSFITISLSLLCAFGVLAQPQPRAENNPPPIDPSNFDTSVKPSDDFFLYANGTWIKRTEIPPEYTRWEASTN